MKLSKKVIMTLEMSDVEIAQLQELVATADPALNFAVIEDDDGKTHRAEEVRVKNLKLFQKDVIHELDKMQAWVD